MKRRTLLILVAVLLVVLVAAAYFGGLFGVAGPSGSVKAWSYETDVSETSFAGGFLSQDFVPTASITRTTSVYALLHASTARYGTYDIDWSIDCNGVPDSGGAGNVTWDTTSIVQEWLPIPASAGSSGSVSVGDRCTLFMDVVPLVKKGGTGALSSSDIAWRQGGTVQACPSCPVTFTRDAIVWGTPATASSAGAKLAINSITSKVSNLTVQWSANVSGGTTPYTYDWSFGDGFRSASPTPTHTYLAAGTYTTTLTVTDVTAATASQSKDVTVSPSLPPAQSTTTYAPDYTLLLVIVAAVVVVGVVVFIYGRRRRWF